MISWPSAPMFQTLARKPTASPQAMRISGEAFSSSSESPLSELSGAMKNACSVAKGSWPSPAKSTAPTTRVSAVAAIGAATRISGRRFGPLLNPDGARPPPPFVAEPLLRPLISSPTSSRLVPLRASDGETLPLQMTSSRSQISKSSSSSSDTISTATPARLRSTSVWRMKAAAPTSTPQVGCDTTQQLRLERDLAADDEFLQVAAGQALRLGAHAIGLDVEASR